MINNGNGWNFRHFSRCSLRGFFLNFPLIYQKILIEADTLKFYAS